MSTRSFWRGSPVTPADRCVGAIFSCELSSSPISSICPKLIPSRVATIVAAINPRLLTLAVSALLAGPVGGNCVRHDLVVSGKVDIVVGGLVAGRTFAILAI
jgi:hypothetical protein